MLKFTEFEIEETDKEMKLFGKLDNGSLIYIQDYDYLYEGDYQFYRYEQGLFNEIYCHDGVSYKIHDGKLFEFIHDMYGVDHEWEITLSMLTKHRDLIPATSHERTSDKPVSPFSL